MTKCVNRPGIKHHYSIVNRDIHFNFIIVTNPQLTLVFIVTSFLDYSCVSLICDCQFVKQITKENKTNNKLHHCCQTLHTSMSKL